MTALTLPSSCVPTTPNRPRRRPTWVEFAIVTVIAAGILDLWFTTQAMSGPGMLEANPLARLLVANGFGALIAFKLVMITLNALPLWLWRDRRVAKIGAFVSLAVMLLLMGQWALWFQTWNQFGPEVLDMLADDPRWIRIHS